MVETCRYCGADVEDFATNRYRCNACIAMHERHRIPESERGCPDCGRALVAHYRCTGCEVTWAVPGRFAWHWQGHGHFHRADDSDWHGQVIAHVDNHLPTRVVVVPDRQGEGMAR